ncbi:MAG: hypothetical protein LRY51_11085 [Geovibrio sp.]|nr:hypothetical protein [Geovibrio sp.]
MWKGEVRIGLTDTTFAECLPTAMAAYKKKISAGGTDYQNGCLLRSGG